MTQQKPLPQLYSSHIYFNDVHVEEKNDGYVFIDDVSDLPVGRDAEVPQCTCIAHEYLTTANLSDSE